MTDQPKQDAIVSQRARELWAYVLRQAGAAEWVARDALAGIDDCDAGLAMIARFQAEIEAATIERCAGVCETWHDPIEATEHENFTYLAIATAIRNLKGQTS